MAHQKILLIDYEPRSIERFRQPLTDAGYTVEVATDGVTGIEAFHRLNPDMVLVEAMIPKKHGFEVCQELKRTPHGRRTPVLITTGVYKGRKYRTQALHIYGCDEYIEKPIAPEQLLAVVGKFFTAAPAEPRAAAPADTAGDPMARIAPPPVPEPAPSRPVTPKPPSSNSVMKDFTEEEIMARLDAILPGGEGPSAFTEAPVMTVTETEPAEIPHEAEIPASEEPDPFLRMQAELTAELGTLSTALALEPAPVFDAPPQADPVVEPPVMPPSVLETLPPIEEAPIVPAPAQPGAAVEPGQLVNFDARRSRRKKRGKQGDRERAATPAQPQAAPVAPSRVTPIAESTRPAEAARAGAFSLPRGTQAEAELSGKTRKPVPVWIWAGLILVGLVVAYLTVSRTSDPKAEAASGSGERADAPSETASRSDLLLNSVEALPAQGSPAPAAAPSTPKPVAAPPATDKTADALPPTGSADAPVQEKASPRTRQATASSIRNWQPSSPATEVPQAPPSAPPGADEGVAGVEAVLDTPIPEAPAAVAAGTLVDAAELDTAPVSLSRKLPVYSMQARQLRIQGTVIMKVLVNERGTVDDVVLVEGVPGADLNSSALKSAKSWTYRPATKSGVPVKVWKVEQVTFKM